MVIHISLPKKDLFPTFLHLQEESLNCEVVLNLVDPSQQDLKFTQDLS